MIKITLELPDDLVSEATAAGILTGRVVAQLLQAELDRRDTVEKYVEVLDALNQLEPPMTQAEIDAEIAALNASRRIPVPPG